MISVERNVWMSEKNKMTEVFDPSFHSESAVSQPFEALAKGGDRVRSDGHRVEKLVLYQFPVKEALKSSHEMDLNEV